VGGLVGGVVLGIIMAVSPAAVQARDTVARFAAAAGLVAVCVGALLHGANQSQLVLLRAELEARAASQQ
jgi:hypothetical protein